MLSLERARQLKEAGLKWDPGLFDLFAIPDRHMDEKVFVISDMLVTIDVLQGLQVVSFQGASEWALDSLVTMETVWLPSESQLRQRLEAALLAAGRPELHILSGLNGCRLDFVYGDQPQTFQAEDLSEAYAQALLYILQTSAGAPDMT